MTELNYDSGVQGIIYALHIGDNNFRYIGLTAQDPSKYLEAHKRKARAAKEDPITGYMRPLHRWMRKYGVESIQMTVLDTPLLEDLNQEEIEYIEEYKALGFDLVNAADGGSGRRGEYVSEETREKIAASKRGTARPPQVHEALRNANLGREPWNKGKTLNEETRKAISNTLKGQKLSDETKQKMSESRTGNPAMALAALKANHLRWHVKRDVIKAGCQLCI